MSEFEYITYLEKNQTALITFNRPKLYNAMNRAMKLEIIKAIKSANKDNKIRSIILTGEGKAFSSGQDLNDRTVQAHNGPVDLGHTLRTEWNPLAQSITSSDKPIIAAVNGVCAGAGISVALSCDLIIAKDKTKFVSGFAQIGLAPDAGSSFILTRALGPQKAYEFFLLGDAIYSEELKNSGIINFLADTPLDKAFEISAKVNSLAPLSVKEIKKNIQYSRDNKLADAIKRETYVQRHLGFSNDYKEGVQAFLEKRAPEFKGN